MKTMTFRETTARHRALLVVLLAIAFSVLFIISAIPTYAHTVEGKYGTVEGVTEDGLQIPDSDLSTTATLYRVGTFHGSDLVLDKAYQNVNFDVPFEDLAKKSKEDYSSETEYINAWMDAAATLSNYVKSDGQPEGYPMTINVGSNGSFKVDGVDNGLYLLKGKSKLINDYPKAGQKAYWWPMPMLVLVWNDDVELVIKPQMELVDKIKINKVWACDKGYADKEKKARPASIKVKVYYLGNDAEPNDSNYWKTVELNADNNWCESWDTSDLGQGKNDPSKWVVQEVVTKDIKANYKVSVGGKFIATEGADGTTYANTITNKYIPPENPTPPAPKTGDDSHMLWYVLVMLAAAAIGLYAAFGRRKKKNNN